ncbi:MAG TPA: glutathione S-transferase N-terminal domain-containing protein [Woeseiaceae bacterium]|nr:glutathione S-transferase N-terminal domain-containing protein [Woeseiaceae bacterium]
MIRLYTWSTPNGVKISIALEELGLDYEVTPIDIGKDEQFSPEFLAISPNNKIPAIVDGEVSLFESGAILLYLAHKTGKLAPPADSPAYFRMLQWLLWQVAHFGPMLGQAHHYLKFNPGKSEYAEKRYHQEALRLYRVLNSRLEGRDFIADGFSIVDIATWPWVSRFEFQQIDLHDFPEVMRWYLALADRPAFQRGYRIPDEGWRIPLP